MNSSSFSRNNQYRHLTSAFQLVCELAIYLYLPFFPYSFFVVCVFLGMFPSHLIINLEVYNYL